MSMLPTNTKFQNSPHLPSLQYNPNMANFQFPTLLFPNKFTIFPLPPTNPSMDQGSSIDTSGGQCNEKEHDTPFESTSKP